jgi:hypothetical protein
MRKYGRLSAFCRTMWKMNLDQFGVKKKIKLGKICRVLKIDSIESVRIDELMLKYKK